MSGPESTVPKQTPEGDDPLDLLTISELLSIAEQSKILQLMGDRQTSRVTVDYIQPREAMFVPREHPSDEALVAFTPLVIPIPYALEDSMFGGTTYVALVAGNRVLTTPFAFGGWDDLARRVFNHQR